MHPALSGLTAYRQFVVFRISPSASRPGKTDKFPCCYLTGKVINSQDPQYWTDATTAEATAAAWGAGWGVGFVFTENDPFWFLDIDGCLINGQWSPLAVSLCSRFAGCAIEVSGSGTGLHIFGTGKPPAHACTNKAMGLEFYHAGRFVALTGDRAVGDCLIDKSAELPALVAEYFPPDQAATVEAEWGSGPREDWYGPADDGELLRRAMMSQSAASKFAHKATFADLWLANESALAVSYPDPNGRSYDASAADGALAQHLAFWTGCDGPRIERMMRTSMLMRDKWDEHATYLRELTIAGAVARQVEVLQDARPVVVPVEPGAPVVASTERGDGFCNLEQQKAHFAGCVYVRGQHRALVPDGTLMKPESFKVVYGGRMFPLDSANTKSTRDAWEAWTQSQVYAPVVVQDTCFNPKLAFGSIVSDDKLLYVNTYMPVDIRRMAGDASPFLTHLAKLLPDERDRSILLAYMAACVQHQGVKFQWAPLIQGAEGNGKTLLSRCVDYTIGSRYTEWPSGETLVSKFNSWLRSKIFIAVEDVHIPESKHHLLDVLKPLITNQEITIEAKGFDQRRAEICANFIFNTNHKDALRKTDDERRICPFFTAQQSKADIERDGMGGDYFPTLYSWLRADGFAIVADYLQHYEIPAAMDPTKDCQRAPKSSSHDEAVSASKGFVEQEIVEAIEAETPGFAGDFISMTMLDRYLEDRGIARRIPPNKRGEILRLMGYIPHPYLTKGRATTTVHPDNTKPRLYVKAGSLASQITSPYLVAATYQEKNVPKWEGKQLKTPSA
jgi:Family of unknown function (DUF5906)